MARITFSPLIIAASGKVKDTVFSKWKGRNYIRARVTPANPQSAAQTLVRDSLARCVTLWQSNNTRAKNAWDLYASPYSMSGYNKFVSANRALEQASSELKYSAHNANIDLQSAMAAVSGSGSGEIDVTWSGGTIGGDYWCLIAVRKVGEDTFTEIEFDTTLNSAGLQTITGLTPSSQYQVYTCVYNDTTLELSESMSDTATALA